MRRYVWENGGEDLTRETVREGRKLKIGKGMAVPEEQAAFGEAL